MVFDRARSISDAELSVVVQGPATAKLRVTVASVRRFVPEAELIVSTWEGSDVTGLDADLVVLSPDPGSAPYTDAYGRPMTKLFNTNRMLTSTLAGLERATRPYVMKLRNDTPLRSAACLAWFLADEWPRVRHHRVFARRIVMPNIAVRPGESMGGYLFHPSDIVHLGLRTDVLDLWTCPLIDEHENSSWFVHRPRPQPDRVPANWSRYYNEQVLWLSCLRRHGMDPGYEHVGHFSADLAALSEITIANNFICAEPWQLGISLPFDDVARVFPRYLYRWFPDWQRTVEALVPT